MGKSGKLIKSLILGAKAFSKDRSGFKKEQSNKTRSQWSLRKSYSCGYEPDDDTEEQQDSKSCEQIDHGNGEFASGVQNDLQSDTILANPTNENSENGLSYTVEKPDNGEVLDEEEGAYVSRSYDESSIDENAAIAIQSAFRGFLCRRAFGALKDEVRLQDLENRQIPRNQTAMDSRYMQALIKVQARVGARQVQMSEEGQTVHQQIQQKCQLRQYNAKSQEDWDYSLDTVDQLHAKQQNKQEAAMRRERALAYAFAQQLRICGKRKSQQADGDYSHQDQQPHLGWTWLERWMAARPSDNITDLEKDKKRNPNPYGLHDNKEDATPPPPHQYGKIQRKKKTMDKQSIRSPTRSLPYNMKSPHQLQAKSILSSTPAKLSTSSGHESPNSMGDPQRQSGSTASHHMITRKQLIFGDEAEESCGSNAICSSPDKAKVDTDHDTKGGSYDPKLQGGGKHKSSEKGPTKLRIPNYMSTTQSSKAKVHHSNEPTKPRQTPSTVKPASLDIVSSTL